MPRLRFTAIALCVGATVVGRATLAADDPRAAPFQTGLVRLVGLGHVPVFAGTPEAENALHPGATGFGLAVLVLVLVVVVRRGKARAPRGA